jgi:hypothetical protein
MTKVRGLGVAPIVVMAFLNRVVSRLSEAQILVLTEHVLWRRTVVLRRIGLDA